MARPRRRIPPRAVSSTAKSTSLRRSTLRAAAGPVQSPVSITSEPTAISSLEVLPTRKPASRAIRAKRRVEVVFPFVARDEGNRDRAQAVPADVASGLVTPFVASTPSANRRRRSPHRRPRATGSRGAGLRRPGPRGAGCGSRSSSCAISDRFGLDGERRAPGRDLTGGERGPLAHLCPSEHDVDAGVVADDGAAAVRAEVQRRVARQLERRSHACELGRVSPEGCT